VAEEIQIGFRTPSRGHPRPRPHRQREHDVTKAAQIGGGDVGVALDRIYGVELFDRRPVLRLDALAVALRRLRDHSGRGQRGHLVGVRADDHRRVILFALRENVPNLVRQRPSVHIRLSSELHPFRVIFENLDDLFRRLRAQRLDGIRAGDFGESLADLLR
jgi:hypothetical protein